MDSVIFRVIQHPHSKTTWLCYANGLKTFPFSKSKITGIKPKSNKFYLVDLKTKTYADGTKTFVQSVHCHGELMTYRHKPSTRKSKKSK